MTITIRFQILQAFFLCSSLSFNNCLTLFSIICYLSTEKDGNAMNPPSFYQVILSYPTLCCLSMALSAFSSACACFSFPAVPSCSNFASVIHISSKTLVSKYFLVFFFCSSSTSSSSACSTYPSFFPGFSPVISIIRFPSICNIFTDMGSRSA